MEFVVASSFQHRDETKSEICAADLIYDMETAWQFTRLFALATFFFGLATLPPFRMTNGNEAQKKPNGEENKQRKVRSSDENAWRERVGKFTAKFVWHWWYAGGGPETRFLMDSPRLFIPLLVDGTFQHGSQNQRDGKMRHDTTKSMGQNLHQLYWTIITLWTNILIRGTTFHCKFMNE